MPGLRHDAHRRSEPPPPLFTNPKVPPHPPPPLTRRSAAPQNFIANALATQYNDILNPLPSAAAADGGANASAGAAADNPVPSPRTCIDHQRPYYYHCQLT